MKGFYAQQIKESESRSVGSFERRWGDVALSSRGAVFERDGVRAVLEGTIVRFIGTDVAFDRADPLSSVAALYRKHGDDFSVHIEGPFLLLFQDAGENATHLVNSKTECHRCYYAETYGGFWFSSRLDELIEIAGLPRNPNFGSIRSFIANGFTISDQTQIEGAKKLLAADHFVFKDGSVEKRNDWKSFFRFERRPFGDLEAHLDEYERRFRGGISDYLEARRPKCVGTLLSGGHDTSFLLIQAAKAVSGPLEAFTVTFPGWAFDEGAFARNIAAKFGAKINEIPFGPGQMDAVLGLIRANEEPVVGSSLPLYHLSSAASRKVDALLGGDGGDTMWGEYYPVAEYHRWVGALPLGLRRALNRIARGLRSATDWERFWELEHVSGLFTESDYHDDFLRKLCTYRHFSDSLQQALFVEDVYREPYTRSRIEVPFTDAGFADALIEGKLFNGFVPYQSFHTSRSVEAFGMDFFMPTLDSRVMELINGLPTRWVNGGTTFHRLINSKTINRKFHKMALARYLRREEIYNRSFDIPWYKVLRPRTRLLDLLERRLAQRGWYREDFLRRLFSEFKTQAVKDYELLELKHHGYRVFTLLSLETWARSYLDGKALPVAGSDATIEEWLE